MLAQPGRIVVANVVQMTTPSTDTTDKRDLAALLAELDRLAAGAKSFFPGRVLLPRKKTYAALDLIGERLVAESEAPDNAIGFDSCRRAIEAVAEVNELAASGKAGPSIWRIWFADVNRKRLAQALQDLHAALEPLLAVRAGH
jgi:hypothetical protein